MNAVVALRRTVRCDVCGARRPRERAARAAVRRRVAAAAFKSKSNGSRRTPAPRRPLPSMIPGGRAWTRGRTCGGRLGAASGRGRGGPGDRDLRRVEWAARARAARNARTRDAGRGRCGGGADERRVRPAEAVLSDVSCGALATENNHNSSRRLCRRERTPRCLLRRIRPDGEGNVGGFLLDTELPSYVRSYEYYEHCRRRRRHRQRRDPRRRRRRSRRRLGDEARDPRGSPPRRSRARL